MPPKKSNLGLSSGQSKLSFGSKGPSTQGQLNFGQKPTVMSSSFLATSKAKPAAEESEVARASQNSHASKKREIAKISSEEIEEPQVATAEQDGEVGLFPSNSKSKNNKRQRRCIDSDESDPEKKENQADNLPKTKKLDGKRITSTSPLKSVQKEVELKPKKIEK